MLKIPTDASPFPRSLTLLGREGEESGAAGAGDRAGRPGPRTGGRVARWPSGPFSPPEPCCCFAELSACDVGVFALSGERVSLGDGLLTLRGRLGKHRSSGAPPVLGFAAVCRELLALRLACCCHLLPL